MKYSELLSVRSNCPRAPLISPRMSADRSIDDSGRSTDSPVADLTEGIARATTADHDASRSGTRCIDGDVATEVAECGSADTTVTELAVAPVSGDGEAAGVVDEDISILVARAAISAVSDLAISASGWQD